MKTIEEIKSTPENSYEETRMISTCWKLRKVKNSSTLWR